MDEGLCEKGIIGGLVGAPGTAMHKHIHRRIRLLGTKDIEPLDGAGAVRNALGGAQNSARPLAVGNPALAHLITIGRIDELIVGVIEFLLVHVQPDQRPLRA